MVFSASCGQVLRQRLGDRAEKPVPCYPFPKKVMILFDKCFVRFRLFATGATTPALQAQNDVFWQLVEYQFLMILFLGFSSKHHPKLLR